MNYFKSTILILTLLITAFSTTFTIAQNSDKEAIKAEAQKQEKLLVGRWFPLTVSDKGMGEGLTFGSDGKVVRRMGVFLAITYKMDGDSLIMVFPDAGEGKQKAAIDDSVLILSGGGMESKLTRVEGNAKNGIVGVWTGRHMTGANQTLYFTASGDEYMIVEMRSLEDVYEISGDQLMIDGGVTKNFTWSINENKLTLTPTDNTESLTYIRLE